MELMYQSLSNMCENVFITPYPVPAYFELIRIFFCDGHRQASVQDQKTERLQDWLEKVFYIFIWEFNFRVIDIKCQLFIYQHFNQNHFRTITYSKHFRYLLKKNISIKVSLTDQKKWKHSSILRFLLYSSSMPI